MPSSSRSDLPIEPSTPAAPGAGGAADEAAPEEREAQPRKRVSADKRGRQAARARTSTGRSSKPPRDRAAAPAKRFERANTPRGKRPGGGRSKPRAGAGGPGTSTESAKPSDRANAPRGGKFAGRNRKPRDGAGGRAAAADSKRSGRAVDASADRRRDKRGRNGRDDGASRRRPGRDDPRPQRAGRFERADGAEPRRASRQRPHARREERAAGGERERSRRTVHRKILSAPPRAAAADGGTGADAPSPAASANSAPAAATASPADVALLDQLGQLGQLEQRLGYTFADSSLLRRALTHSSASADNYERLEFLGDAALGFAVGRLLFDAFADASEQQLTLMRSHLVSATALAEVAGELELGAFLVLSAAERRDGGAARPSILADALEAVFGAVACDGGMEAVAQCVRRLFAGRVAAAQDADLKDPKTRLQEHLQQRGLALPRYEIVAAGGLAHAPVYAVECVLESLGVRAKGVAGSRREAEKRAAGAALATLAKATSATTGGEAPPL